MMLRTALAFTITAWGSDTFTVGSTPDPNDTSTHTNYYADDYAQPTRSASGTADPGGNRVVLQVSDRRAQRDSYLLAIEQDPRPALDVRWAPSVQQDPFRPKPVDWFVAGYDHVRPQPRAPPAHRPVFPGPMRMWSPPLLPQMIRPGEARLSAAQPARLGASLVRKAKRGCRWVAKA